MGFDENGELDKRFEELRGTKDIEKFIQFGMDVLKAGLQELEVELAQKDIPAIDQRTYAAVLTIQGIRCALGLPELIMLETE